MLNDGISAYYTKHYGKSFILRGKSDLWRKSSLGGHYIKGPFFIRKDSFSSEKVFF